MFILDCFHFSGVWTILKEDLQVKQSYEEKCNQLQTEYDEGTSLSDLQVIT